MKQLRLFPGEKVYSLNKNEDRQALLAQNPYLGPKNSRVGYKKYIWSEALKKKAKFARQLADQKCELCLEKGRLDVHHPEYDCLYNERFDNVLVLCRDCHIEEGEIYKKKASYWTWMEKKYGENCQAYLDKHSWFEFELWYEDKKRTQDEGWQDDFDNY